MHLGSFGATQSPFLGSFGATLAPQLALQSFSMSFLWVSKLLFASFKCLSAALAPLWHHSLPCKAPPCLFLGFQNWRLPASNASRQLWRHSGATACLAKPLSRQLWRFLAPQLALQSPSMSFLRISKLLFASLQMLLGSFGATLAPQLAFQSPSMSFLRVSKLPFASLQMLLGSFGATLALQPCLAKPLHVFS